MTLRDWLNNGWLAEHRATPGEVADLLAVADRDLADCRTEGLSSDWRLGIAYNAALQLGIVALAAEGYRASRDAHHFRVIQSLAHTIVLEPSLVNRLDRFRKKRNMGEYERAGAISQQEADEMLALALDLRDKVENWLRARHPELLPPA
jgi:hypothetical protein